MADLQGLLEASPDAVVVADRSGEITRANHHVEAVLGYSPGDLEGMTIEDLLDPEDRETHREHRESYMTDPEPRPMGQNLDLYARRADGSRIPVEISLGPVEADGELQVVATVTDVSERKERIEALRESEARYRRLLDISPAPIVIYDDETTIQYANEAVADLLGVAGPDVVVDTPTVEFIHPDDRAASREGVRTVLEDREPVENVERRLVTPDGEVRHVSLSSAPITYDGGPAAQVLLSDITELKERERALERQNERLDEFASIVSHDLRNPLTVLETSLELARETGETEHFERAERATDRMAQLVDDVLAIARHGETPEATEAVDVADVARAAWGTVETPGADLSVPAEGTVEAEPTRLQALFENLFRNAVEHGTGSGDPPADDALSVRVGDHDSGFFVADDGVGVPSDEREQLFERGYSTAEEGTGYGLAIVAEIVRAHDWEIDLAESEVGGARFEIET